MLLTRVHICVHYRWAQVHASDKFDDEHIRVIMYSVLFWLLVAADTGVHVAKPNFDLFSVGAMTTGFLLLLNITIMYRKLTYDEPAFAVLCGITTLFHVPLQVGPMCGVLDVVATNGDFVTVYTCFSIVQRPLLRVEGQYFKAHFLLLCRAYQTVVRLRRHAIIAQTPELSDTHGAPGGTPACFIPELFPGIQLVSRY